MPAIRIDLFYIATISALSLCVADMQGQAPVSQSRDSTAMPEMLKEVTVSIDRHKEEVVAPKSLKGAELSRLNAHSVADAVRYFAGVQLKDYGGVGGIKTLDIRSMGTNHMGVFYDGLPLGNAQNGQIDLGKFSLDNIEEIALYNAQKSTIFQPARDFASSGSLYITSRRPHFLDGRRTAGSVTFRTGSFGLVNPSLRVDRRITDLISATASVEYTYATGRYKFRYHKRLPSGDMAWDTTAIRRNGDIHALRAEAGLYGTLDNGLWTAKAYFYDSGRGIPGAIVNNVWKNSQRQWDRNFFAQGRFRQKYGERLELMANAKYARDRMRYLNPDTTLMLIDNTFLQQETYVSATAQYSPFHFWDIALAADWQYNTLDSDMTQFAYPRRHHFMGSVATAINHKEWRVRGSLLLSEIQDRTHPKGKTEHHKHIERLTPAIFIARLSQKAYVPELRAFWKKAFRMPTFNDLYYTDIGNARLNPEGTTQLDFGMTWRLKPTAFAELLELSADIYHNRVTDKIIAVPKGTGQYRWMMMNIGLVKINGADITCATTLKPYRELTCRLRLNYTYQSARDYSDPSDNTDAAGTYKGQIAYIPMHAASVAAGLQWHNAEINYSFIYTGERWDGSSNIRANYIEPWYTSDLSASYPITIGLSTLRLTLEINNLADQQYEVIRNYPMPGRNFKIIAQWNF